MGPMTLFFVLLVSVAAILVGGIRFSHWWYERENKNQFDGHTVRLWLGEDGDWMVAIEDMPTVSAFGKTPADALRELATAWAGVRESFRQRGEPVPAPSHADTSPTRDAIKVTDFNGFAIKVWLSEPDQEWVAQLVDFPGEMGVVSASRKTPENAIKELRTVWQLIEEALLEQGREMPMPALESRMDHIETKLDRRNDKAADPASAAKGCQ